MEEKETPKFRKLNIHTPVKVKMSGSQISAYANQLDGGYGDYEKELQGLQGKRDQDGYVTLGLSELFYLLRSGIVHQEYMGDILVDEKDLLKAEPTKSTQLGRVENTNADNGREM